MRGEANIVSDGFILAVLVTTQVLGDICLSRGMKIYGEITSYSPQALLDLITYLFTSFWIWLGVATLAFSWFLYLVSVSRMDLSYVLPIHASSYVLNALMAWLILDEVVSPLRWLATITIALGVFIVGWSEYLTRKRAAKLARSLNIDRKTLNTMMLSLPLAVYLPKVWLGVLVLVLADAVGDILTARGMKQVGKITSLSLQGMVNWIGRIATNVGILVGIFSQAIALLMFISLLSWDDISLVRPATALGYVVSLLAAKYILQEKIHQGRLVGIIVIGCGVAIISLT